MDRSAKRVKLSQDDLHHGVETLLSYSRPITPPAHRPNSSKTNANVNNGDDTRRRRVIRSPIQLTHIRDLGDARTGPNRDTVKLGDILGDPLIRECWQFNYVFDVDFLMSQFDADVRRLVQVKVVHGSWKKDAPNRVRIDVGGWPDRLVYVCSATSCLDDMG